MNDVNATIYDLWKKRINSVIKCGEFKVLAAIVVISAGIIWFPWQNPYVSVPGSTVVFEVGQFHKCAIAFASELTVHSYSIAIIDVQSRSPSASTVNSRSKDLDRDLSQVDIENLFETREPKLMNLKSRYKITIDCSSSINCDIESVSMDNKTLNLQSFVNDNLKTQGRLIKVHYIRKDIARWLYRLNDPVSNFVLTVLWVGICLLALKVAKMEWTAYFCGKTTFERDLASCLGTKSISKLDTNQRRDALDKYSTLWESWDGRFRFWQMLGPAIGFILTVSSLILAFFTVRNTNDLDSFTRGLNVAMVSTFLGLLLRIVSLEAERVNFRLLIRADLCLGGDELRALDSNGQT